MYSVVCKQTGQILAKNLTLDAVDSWVSKHASQYANIQTVGMTIFVLDKA